MPNPDFDASFHIPAQGYFYIENQPGIFEYFMQKCRIHEIHTHHLVIPYVSTALLFNLLKDLPDIEALTNVLPEKQNGVQLSLNLSYLKERLKHELLVQIIISGNLTSYFQPIIRLEDNRVHGYESLLRTDLPEPNIPPGKLFEVAHKTGLHSLLDLRAREAALEARAKKLPGGVKSFINFLPASIYDFRFCLAHTFTAIEQHHISPEDLVFEVVETEKMKDVYFLKSILDVYRGLGVEVALDDLGSGYATLETLKILNPDYVKIDRFFISYCDQNKIKQRFLQEVMRIANATGIFVLAEGVERQEELAYCKSIGMHYAQGYYIGKPAPDPNLAVVGRN